LRICLFPETYPRVGLLAFKTKKQPLSRFFAGCYGINF